MTVGIAAPPRPEPLILTAMLDPASQNCFEQQRQRHFPRHLNIVPAHVTLFHHLPGLEQAAVERLVADRCRRQMPAPFTTTGLRFLGGGTAYLLDMPAAAQLRQELAAAWWPWLTAQDRQSWKPHVTVQNKVPADRARQVHAQLLADFAPQNGLVNGLCLWRYMGHWELLGRHLFANRVP